MEAAMAVEETGVATAGVRAATAAPRVGTEATVDVGLLVVEVASVVRHRGPAVALRVAVVWVAMQVGREMAAVAQAAAATAAARGVAQTVAEKVAGALE